MTRAPAIDIVTAMNSPALFQRWFPGESWDGWRAVLIADFTDANRALAAKAAKISGAAEMRPSRGPLASDVNASGPRFAVMGMTKMGAEKKRVGRPPNPVAPAKPTLWEKPAVAQQLDEILIALEIPPLDAKVRAALQRKIYRVDYFGGECRGEIILTLRCILESSGNEDALVEPIVSAVSTAIRGHEDRGLALEEAFDRILLTAILQTMRGLDLFSENSIGHYFGIALRNKLAAILEPLISKPAPVRAKPIAPSKRRAADQLARQLAA